MKIPSQAEILQAYKNGEIERDEALKQKNKALYEAALAESKEKFTEEKVAEALLEAARNQYWVKKFMTVKYEIHDKSGYKYGYIPFPHEIISKIRAMKFVVETWANEITVTLRTN